MATGEVVNYFPGSNTCQGFYSFYEYLPHSADLIFIIKGGPGTGKSTLLKEIGSQFRAAGYDIELHWCSSDPESLDGVVIPQLKTALMDGTAPHLIDPEYPGAVEEIINLGRYWNKGLLQDYKHKIITLNDVIWKCFDQAYAYLKEAKLIHDIWEEYYRESMNFQLANRRANSLIKEIVGSREVPTEVGGERHLFASAFTPQGAVDYFNQLTKKFAHRYVVKGRPGTGKSTLTNKVAQAAREHGFAVNYFHCSFDPDSVDLITIPNLDAALVDGTPPHVVEPTEKDEVIDMLEYAEWQEINQKEEKIEATKRRYQGVMKKAEKKLSKAKELHDQLEKYYIKAMDFSAVDGRREEIVAEICDWAGIKLE